MDTTPSLSAVVEPVPPVLERLLRRAVLDHAGSESRRVFPAVVHVGVPGQHVAHLALGDQRLDHALRTDVLEAMVRRTRPVTVVATRAAPQQLQLAWLTRRGELLTHDLDLAWLAAARTAAAELGQVLPFVVVTRSGWRDPSTGACRTWSRLRPSRPQPASRPPT